MYNHDHSSSSKRIGWAFFLNLIFTIIEFKGNVFKNALILQDFSTVYVVNFFFKIRYFSAM